ncbi:MAG: FMN-binding protein [Gammaproteobacteria bacterium]|nr:FMN-binding protein [Gammaproteobacteria bacterium]
MIITLGGIAMLSGLLVVLTWQLTLAPIRENQRIMIEKAIFQVIPGATQRRSYALTDKGLEDLEPQSHANKNSSSQDKYSQTKAAKNSTLKFYAAYDVQGQLKGIAAEAAAQGYADIVRLLYGYDPQCQCIRGFSIIKMAETPGLGDKILTDENFLDNFSALDARLSYDKKTLGNPIITVKHGSKNNPWEIDAISGATITSKAVGKAINQGAEQLLPKLYPYLQQLQTNSSLNALSLNLKKEKGEE